MFSRVEQLVAESVHDAEPIVVLPTAEHWNSRTALACHNIKCLIDLLTQGDQMVRLYFEFLAVYNNETFAKTTKKGGQSGNISPNLVTLVKYFSILIFESVGTLQLRLFTLSL